MNATTPLSSPAEVVRLHKNDLRRLKQRDRRDKSITYIRGPLTAKLWQEEYFFWIDRECGDMLFNITRIRKAILSKTLEYRVLELPVDKPMVDSVLKAGSVDIDYARSLSLDVARTPLLAVLWPDKSSQIIDGNQRVIKLAESNEKRTKLIQLYPGKGPAYWPHYVQFGKLGQLNPEMEAEFDKLRQQLGIAAE